MTAIAAGDTYGLAVKSDGTVWGWGHNDHGQLGDNSTTERDYAVQSGLTGAVAVAAGAAQSLGLKSNGTVWAWGYNDYGDLGNNSTTDSHVPVQVIKSTTSTDYLTGVVAIGAGYHHSLAVDSSGNAWAWGYNGYGALGDGTTSSRYYAAKVLTTASGNPALTGAIAIAGGGYLSTSGHSLALDSSGYAWAWGRNGNGQLGDNTTSSRNYAAQVSGLTGVTDIDAGYNYSLADDSSGNAWAWGSNSNGCLGDGTTTDRHTPVQVKTTASGNPVLTGVTDVAAGEGGGSSSLFLQQQ